MNVLNKKLFLIVFLLTLSSLTFMATNQTNEKTNNKQTTPMITNTVSTSQTQSSVYDLGRLINFEQKAYSVNDYANYIKFSSGFTRWNSSGNSAYPAHSGDFVAYTYGSNNNITFTVPQKLITAYFTVTGASSNHLYMLGYDWLGDLVANVTINGGSINYVTGISYNGISRIAFRGDFSNWQQSWVIDDLYCENATSLSSTIDFETNATFNYANYIHFSPGYVLWNSTGNNIFKAHSGTNIAYTYEQNNYINFTVPQLEVSAYITINSPPGGDVFFLAYDSYGQLVGNMTVPTGSINYYAHITYSGITSIMVKGNFNNWYHTWALDDLFSENATTPLVRLINFDLPTATNSPNDYSNYIHFSPGYTIGSFIGSQYPPESGNRSVYTTETGNYINFDVPQQYIGAYFTINGPSTDRLFMEGYDQWGQLVENSSIPGGYSNYYQTLNYPGVVSVLIRGNFANWQSLWTMDSLKTVNATYIARLINFDISVSNLSNYASYVHFSPGYSIVNAYPGSAYPPYSGTKAVYTSEMNNYINFDTPQDFVSAYFDFNYASTYDLFLLAYDQYNQLVANTSIHGGSLVYGSVSYNGISKVVISGNAPSWNNYWEMDNLVFENATSLDRMINFDTGVTNFADYSSYVNFSPNFATYNESLSTIFHPHSGDFIAYTHDSYAYANFTIPQKYVSAYFSFSGTNSSYALTVSALDAYGQIVGQYVIPQNTNNYHTYFTFKGIRQILIQGNLPNWEQFWVMDDLFFMNCTTSTMSFDPAQLSTTVPGAQTTTAPISASSTITTNQSTKSTSTSSKSSPGFEVNILLLSIIAIILMRFKRTKK